MATGADQTTYTYYPAASLHAGRVASMTIPVAAGSGAAAGTTYYDYPKNVSWTPKNHSTLVPLSLCGRANNQRKACPLV